MLGEKCRIREANVRFMEIINGVKNEHNLCAQCAAEMNFGPYTTLLEGEFNLGMLLSGLMVLPAASEADKSLTEVVCPTCGTTLLTPLIGTIFSTGGLAITGTISTIITWLAIIIAILSLKRLGEEAYVIIINEKYLAKKRVKEQNEKST